MRLRVSLFIYLSLNHLKKALLDFARQTRISPLETKIEATQQWIFPVEPVSPFQCFLHPLPVAEKEEIEVRAQEACEEAGGLFLSSIFLPRALLMNSPRPSKGLDPMKMRMSPM